MTRRRATRGAHDILREPAVRASTDGDRRRSTFASRVKRALDVLVAVDALVVSSPVMGLVALAIGRTMGRPILFRQVRPGYGTAPFTILKFRTMTDARDASGELAPMEARTTRLGGFLRATSLDELPEFWNVLMGEMSVVGPRPMLEEYLPLYTAEQARRHEVRPGITGWAQVNGRHLIDFDRRFALDVWYVDHWSLRLDARIVAMTIREVLGRHGAGPGKLPPSARDGTVGADETAERADASVDG